MAQAAVRFGVVDGRGRRAASWKCWAEIGKGKSDVFLACRVLGGVIKASLHQSGEWHVAYDRTGFSTMFDEAKAPPTRFIRKWTRPPELFRGVTLAVRVVVPWHAATVSDSALDPQVTWLQTAPRGKAIEFAVILTSKEKVYGEDWPGRRTMETELVGQLALDSGERAWVVYHLVDWTDRPPISGPHGWGFAKNKNVDDLQGEDVRAIDMDQRVDGSFVFYDLPVKVHGGQPEDAAEPPK